MSASAPNHTSGSKGSEWILSGICLLLFVGFIVYCKQQKTKDYKRNKAKQESLEDYIKHADTFYWFALLDHGGTPALESGDYFLEKAKKKFKEKYDPERKTLQEKLNKSPDDKETAYKIAKIDKLEARMKGTEQDLMYQRELAHDTFRGIFPWSHYLARPSLFHDPRATVSYELIDQPQVVASRAAVKDLTEKVLASQTVTAQHDVVFVVDPDDFQPEVATNAAAVNELATQLENEALYLFNLDPRFFVHNMLEVATALNEEELTKLRKMELTTTILQKLRNTWGNRDILVCKIKRLDEVKHYHFYLAQGHVYHGTDPEPAMVLNNYGFCRDRRFVFSAVVFFNLLLLVGAVAVFRTLVRITAPDGASPSWRDSLGLGILGFIWGRAAVWGLAEIVEEFIPKDETLALLSFWWPMATGVAMLLGPALVLRFAEERFHRLEHWFGLYNRRGALFAAVTMGSVAYIGTAALYVGYWGSWLLLPPLVIGSVFAGWIVGRALETSDPMKFHWGVSVFVLALGLGPAFASAAPAGLHAVKMWVVALPILVVGLVAVRKSPMIASEQIQAEDDDVMVTGSGIPETTTELIRHAQNPPFTETASFKDAYQRLDAWREGRTVHLQLVGAAGIGKTALINALRQSACQGRTVAVMQGTCPEPQENAKGENYRVFADAIAEHFSINLLAPPENQLAGIDHAVDEIFEEVVPFSDLLFPPSHGHGGHGGHGGNAGGSSGSKTELFHSVFAMLRQLATGRPVLLIVDDAHWLDSGSTELLEYLLKALPCGGDVPVAIVVASRHAISGVATAETFKLEQLSEPEIRELLTYRFGFKPNASAELAEAVGNEEGNLHWLFQMITYMAGKDELKFEHGSWGWDAKTKLADHLPDDLKHSVLAVLNEHPEYRPILECAACIGPKFTVEVLTEAVGLSRFECIRLLDQIETKTGFVRDLHHEDDTFGFRSSFLLEVIRQLLGVKASGPQEPAPQRIREYHSALANAWHSTIDKSSSALFKLATHRYAAGRRHSDRAVSELVDAAWASSGQFQHEQARDFVNMARECAAASGRDDGTLERELLLIECREAHVEGRNRVAMAGRTLAAIDKHPDSPFSVYAAAALACYDAGIDTRDQKHFADTVAIGRRIVEKFAGLLELAAGHHFIGIGLPRTEAAEQREHWEKAMELLEQVGETNDALRLKAKIANSLAEQMSYGSDDERGTAKQLFRTSIELKTLPEIRDVAGLAMSHGGLGRLAFFAKEPDYATAREHFSENLRLSENIGSIIGQTKMHSMLAGVDVAEQDFGGARQHYAAAYELAEEQVDRIFSLAGLIEVHSHLDQTEAADRHGELLLELIKSRLEALSDADRAENPVSAIPGICLTNLSRSLEKAVSKDSRWHRWLSGLIDDNRILAE